MLYYNHKGEGKPTKPERKIKMYEVSYEIYGVKVVAYVPNLVAMDAITNDASTTLLGYRWIEPEVFVEKEGH